MLPILTLNGTEDSWIFNLTLSAFCSGNKPKKFYNYQIWLGCYRSHNTGSLYVCQSNLTKDITNRRQRYMPKTCLCYKSQFKIVGGLKVLNL